MTTTQLQVFRKMYDLNLMLIRLVNNFPKQYKYNVGDELIKTSLRLFKHLFAANREYDNKIKRVEHLDNFLDDYDLLKVLIRLANEERMFSHHKSNKIKKQIMDKTTKLKEYGNFIGFYEKFVEC